MIQETVNETAYQKRSKSLRRRIAGNASKLLNAVQQSETRPRNLEYFIDVLNSVYVSDDVRHRLDDEGGTPQVIGVYCMMIPEELIYAAGFIPLRLCGGSYEAFLVGGDHTPRDACPVVKASVGSSLTGVPSVYGLCDIVIVPTTCDAKRKAAEELSRITEVWMLETPHIKDTDTSREGWRRQIYGLVQMLDMLAKQKSTGKKINRLNLKKAMEMVGAASYEMRRLCALRKTLPPPLSGIEASIALSAYAFDRADRWTRKMNILNGELEKRCENNISKAHQIRPRLLLAGSPSIFPHWKIPLLADEMGADIVVDESCVGDRLLYDTVARAERTLDSMIEGIAARYLAPCVCPVFTPNEDRLRRLIELADEFTVDGVIYHVLKGCIPYDFELGRVEKMFRERGTPVLRIETDYTPEDVEQLRTRIEAFIEMFAGKKNNKNKKGDNEVVSRY